MLISVLQRKGDRRDQDQNDQDEHRVSNCEGGFHVFGGLINLNDAPQDRQPGQHYVDLSIRWPDHVEANSLLAHKCALEPGDAGALVCPKLRRERTMKIIAETALTRSMTV